MHQIITFIPKSSAVNNIFQYMTTIVFSIIYKHEYLSYDKFQGVKDEIIYVNDDNVFDYLNIPESDRRELVEIIE
jgi:hypothetical protein